VSTLPDSSDLGGAWLQLAGRVPARGDGARHPAQTRHLVQAPHPPRAPKLEAPR